MIKDHTILENDGTMTDLFRESIIRKFAIRSLVLGTLACIFSILLYVTGLGWIIAICLLMAVSIICGIFVLRQEQNDKSTRLMAKIGIALSIMTFVAILIVTILSYLDTSILAYTALKVSNEYWV